MRRDASAYIRASFQPEDRLAVVLIQQEGEEKGKVVQKFWSAEMASRPKTRGVAALPERARLGRLRQREPAQAREPGGAARRTCWKRAGSTSTSTGTATRRCGGSTATPGRGGSRFPRRW